jgi:hypothetical protein
LARKPKTTPVHMRTLSEIRTTACLQMRRSGAEHPGCSGNAKPFLKEVSICLALATRPSQGDDKRWPSRPLQHSPVPEESQKYFWDVLLAATIGCYDARPCFMPTSIVRGMGLNRAVRIATKHDHCQRRSTYRRQHPPICSLYDVRVVFGARALPYAKECVP